MRSHTNISRNIEEYSSPFGYLVNFIGKSWYYKWRINCSDWRLKNSLQERERRNQPTLFIRPHFLAQWNHVKRIQHSIQPSIDGLQEKCPHVTKVSMATRVFYRTHVPFNVTQDTCEVTWGTAIYMWVDIWYCTYGKLWEAEWARGSECSDWSTRFSIEVIIFAFLR